jgi:hypothetical protein
MMKAGDGSFSVCRWGMLILLLLVFFAQLALGSRQLSLTSDEPPHLGAGYTYLTTGETWHIPSLGNPPLIIAWIALPTALANPRIPLQILPNWGAFALPPYFRALFPLLGPVEQLEVAGRVPVMLLGVLLGSLVFRWAADLFGYKGGLLALALMVFDPTMVAHAQLATIDVGVTMLGFATFFVCWRSLAWRRSGLWWDVGIGLLAGATMAAKVSGVVWVGLVVGMTLVVEVVRSAGQKPGFFRKTWFLVRRTATIGAVALLFLWGIYGFRVGPVSVGSYVLTVPASHHWEGLLQQMASPAIRLMFLAGEAGVGGWWWYFPFAFLIKNPVPLLAIWIGAIVLSVWHRSLTLVDFLFLLAFPAVYMAVAIYSKVNIGYRHLLPIHPFLYVLAAQLPSRRFTRPLGAKSVTGNLREGRVLWVGLWVWYVVGTLRVFPHYLAYFNELAGGPRNGYRYLVDSNLDWGQGFKALKKELDRLDVRSPLRLGHHWYVGPESYGVEYEPLPPLPGAPAVFSPRFDPPPGTYVLGATLLQRGSGDLEQYEWFKHHDPIAQPGYALFVYRVDPHQPPATWIAQCVEPAAPLDEEVIAREFHTQPLRRVYFDCTQSWIYPEDGQTSGWYALHDQVLQAGGPFWQPHLDQAHLSYVHDRYDGIGPAFRLYEFSPGMQGVAVTSTARVAPPGMSPAQVAAERPLVEAPLQLDGPLDFVGYRLVEATPEAVALETWWRVTEVGDAGARPLSIMAHLVGDDGHPVGVADGLGVPVEVWQAGDVLVQYHHFPLAPGEWGSDADAPLPVSGRGWGRDLVSDAPLPVSGRGSEGLWLQTGVYWLDTLERQAVAGPGQATGDHILVGEIRLAGEPVNSSHLVTLLGRSD